MDRWSFSVSKDRNQLTPRPQENPNKTISLLPLHISSFLFLISSSHFIPRFALLSKPATLTPHLISPAEETGQSHPISLFSCILTFSPPPQMAETHLVEIPSMATSGGSSDNDHQQSQQTLLAAMQHHPLSEISTSRGHLLLLKLWQRDEGLLADRIGVKETRLDAIKREAFQLCSVFFFFHGLFLTLLFTSSLAQSADRRSCRGWWLPACISLVTSLVLIFSVQLRICSYWRVHGQLQREKGEGRALARCVQELRMKGASFDLSKGPQTAKRMKSSSVQVKWRPLLLLSRNAVTICLLCFSGMLFPACKFILCD